MAVPNIVGGLLGGALIGLASALLLLLNGRIAGISGILGGIIKWSPTGRPVGRNPEQEPPAKAGAQVEGSDVLGERFWRVAFILGLVGGAALYGFMRGGFPLRMQAAGPMLILAGLLVGFGTRLGSGCTSGHGVCGLARRSPRSLVATTIFMIVAALTVFLTRHLF
jgi:hypothetical protein